MTRKEQTVNSKKPKGKTTKSVGRMTKNLGDAGLDTFRPSEEIIMYQAAVTGKIDVRKEVG